MTFKYSFLYISKYRPQIAVLQYEAIKQCSLLLLVELGGDVSVERVAEVEIFAECVRRFTKCFVQVAVFLEKS